MPPNEADDLAHVLIVGGRKLGPVLPKYRHDPPAARVADTLPRSCVRSFPADGSTLLGFEPVLDFDGAHVHRCFEALADLPSIKGRHA